MSLDLNHDARVVFDEATPTAAAIVTVQKKSPAYARNDPLDDDRTAFHDVIQLGGEPSCVSIDQPALPRQASCRIACISDLGVAVVYRVLSRSAAQAVIAARRRRAGI